MNRIKSSGTHKIWRDIVRDKWLYIMLIPGIVYFLVFKYGAMYGLIIAFEDFSPFKGFIKSPFVGLKHFARLINDPAFKKLFVNTLALAVLNIVFYFLTIDSLERTTWNLFKYNVPVIQFFIISLLNKTPSSNAIWWNCFYSIREFDWVGLRFCLLKTG